MLSLRVACVLAIASISPRATGQCPGWTDPLELAGMDGTVYCSTVYDDGTGPALIVGGTFQGPSGLSMPHLARWNGNQWSDLGGTTNGNVNALVVADDGTGPKLFAGGSFTTIGGTGVAHLAKWDGTSWSGVGSSTPDVVDALFAARDASGWRLYASDMGTSAAHVLKFDGTTWTTIGHPGGPVWAMCEFDFGSGPDLVAGGAFQNIDGTPVFNIARWNGASWGLLAAGLPAIDAGTNGDVLALLPYDDGSGPSLFVGGNFGTVGGAIASFVARFDGTAFHALPGTSGFGRVYSFAVHDDGSGNALYAGSLPSSLTNAQPVHRWNGSTWTDLGSGTYSSNFQESFARTLASFDDGNGPGLVVGGSFDTAGGHNTPSLGLWRNGAWETVGHENGVRGEVRALARFDDGSGPAVYVGGAFDTASDRACANVARFDGQTFAPLGAGVTRSGAASSGVEALCAYDAGNGSQLYVGGLFQDAGGVASTSGIARWNGAAWSSLGSGISNPGGYAATVRALLVHDEGSGPRLIVGGRFQIAGGAVVNSVARWDGTSWSPMGSGLVAPAGVAIPVMALAVYDTGSGPEVYAAGSFSLPDSTWYIARWNGTTWSSVGAGIDGPFGYVEMHALCVTDLGNGPKLYAGGRFFGAAGISSPNLAAWDGAWSAPSGLGNTVGWIYALATFDEGAGTGPSLFIGGDNSFSYAGIARYDGSALSTLDAGLVTGAGNSSVAKALLAFDDPHGAPALYAGGAFQRAGTVAANGVARWRGCEIAGQAFCSGDGTATACPCGNSGASGHGCATSNNAQGARLEASGLASVLSDSLVLACTGTSTSIVTYFQGTQHVNAGAGAIFGDGLRCAGGTTLRLAHVLASGGTSSFPNAGDAAVSVRGAVGALGGRRDYQVWFRNAASFCTPSTFNLSNGWSVIWAP